MTWGRHRRRGNVNNFDDDIDDLNEDELWNLSISPSPLTRAQALMALGRRAAMTDNTERALTLVDTAIEAWGQADQPREQGFAWYIRCRVLINDSRYAEGLEAINRAGEIYSEVSAPDYWQADVAQSRATCHRGLGQWPDALAAILEARALFELAGNDHAAAHAAIEVAECTKDADIVMTHLTWARDVFRREENAEWVLIAQDEMVASLSRNRKYAEAAELATENVNLAKFLDMPPRIAKAQRRLGLCHYLLNRPEEATVALEKAAELFHAQHNWDMLADVRHYLVDCYGDLNRNDEAADLLQQLAAFHRAAGDTTVAGELEFQQLRRTDGDETSDPLLPAYEVHRNDLAGQIRSATERGDTTAAARARLDLAESYMGNNDVGAVLATLDGMFTSELSSQFDQSRHLVILMRTAMYRGRWEEARALGDRAITAADTCQDPGMAGRAYLWLIEVAQHDRDAHAEAEYRRHAIALLLEAGLNNLARAAAFDDIPERTLEAASAIADAAAPDAASDTMTRPQRIVTDDSSERTSPDVAEA